MNEPEAIREMLRDGLTIAVVGMSDDPAKASHRVSAYMQSHGYRILPVNPTIPSALGETAYKSLSELPVTPDVVDVFRLPAAIPAIVDEMIALGLKRLWVQQGIVDLESAAKAEAAGIQVVMDRCIMVEHAHRAKV
ncbi:CoA-binding protein [Granulicella sp. WH15]|uniref:CoA-binding protein n=1 Tax=Granulicella sp. WH15 TaxID=2602070 RepID=UPI001366F19D|nr:CoA-binding protein [Granulicella sp. WH15]QHN03354.1 CoA-binding protein [Granulicella sp. WH15]